MAYNDYSKGGHNGGYKGANKGGYKGGNNKAPIAIQKDFFNPYTFIPFSNHVYELNDKERQELDYIQDVPVEGALSGKIKIDFEAVTPFCVRKSDGNNINVDGQYFIPGTTIKGMIRSVFEILTLANARNGISNDRYSSRDLNSDKYELKKGGQKSGFLIKYKNKYYIQECESARWKYKDIEEKENVQGLKFARRIQDKYVKVLNRKRITTVDDGNKAMWFFSGFMSKKEHEFLFSIPKFEEDKLIRIDSQEWEDFLFIHENENENEGWKFWRGILRNTDTLDNIENVIVPCFFRKKENECTVRDLGFSYLYRQPYNHTLHDFIPREHKEGAIDMAQAVFGYVNKSKALKGRVMVGNTLIENARVLSSQTFILGSPKPSYYPFYVEQNTPGAHSSYFTNKAQLSGRKRYILHNDADKGNVPSSNVTCSFCPIDKNTKFSTTVYFHNLHDYELGALLASITFCENYDCHHSMGYAKPFGYGRIKVVNCNLEECEYDIHNLISTFIDKLTENTGITEVEWRDYIDKLLFIAKGSYSDDKAIRYPIMDKKEFKAVKNAKYSINDFEPQGKYNI